MKKIKAFLLLLPTVFFSNAQSKHAHSGVEFRKHVSIIITNDFYEINTPKFSIHFKDDFNYVSHSSNIKLAISIHNYSSYEIGMDEIYRIRTTHTKGYYFNASNCNQIKGGVGGVVIRPLKPGESGFYDDIILPDNGNGRAHFLSSGFHFFDLAVDEIDSENINEYKVMTKKKMTFRVVYMKGKDKNICESTSKTTDNVSQDLSVYPNPFNHSVKFDISKQKFNFPVSLQLYNDKGILQDSFIFKNENNKELSYYKSDLPSGIYFYKLTDGNTMKEGTLIRK